MKYTIRRPVSANAPAPYVTYPYVTYNKGRGFGFTSRLQEATTFDSVEEAVMAVVDRTKQYPEASGMRFTIVRLREVTTPTYVEEAL